MAARKTAAAVAEVPAETSVAQRSEYDSMVLIGLIKPHPKNVRHNTIADAELVESIRQQGLLQPLVLTPTEPEGPNPQGLQHYLLIAGHRRLDGLKKAGYTHAPAIIRHDLGDEADQVAAMLVENGRRADLTAMEEAEGFDLLTELGWDVDQIAAASGRSKTLIKERRRLTKLPEKAKAAVELGQITIDEGLTMTKLPPKEQEALIKHAGTHNFKYEIRSAENRATAQREVELQAKKLLARGIPELDKPKDVNYAYGLNFAKHGCTSLGYSGKPNASDHEAAGCLAFIRGGTKQYPALWEVCTDLEKHRRELAEAGEEPEEEFSARQADIERLNAERAEKRRAEAIARGLRVDAVVAGLKHKRPQIDPVLQNLMQLALPILAYEGEPDHDTFFAAANVPEELRSKVAERGEGWIAYLSTLQGLDLVKAFTAYLADTIESDIEDNGYISRYQAEKGHAAGAYFRLLDDVGHERNDQDIALLERFNPPATSDDDEAVA